MKRFTKFGLVVVLLAISAGYAQIDSPLYRLPLETMLVQTPEGAEIEFEIVVVNTNADRAQGLMYVRFLPLDHGMLFQFPRKRVLSMWMKNTHISLDMWFVSNDGEIVHVVEHTTPESLESISSQEPAAVVVEVNAGLSSLLGVTPGTVIEHRSFDNQNSKP
ncbi:MAG: DUF192 domain-containing protein [Gammaproteobacteria bacterium]|nr:DUF192 domain-containing protein [Gammaproteobacteria bacterium]